MKKIPIKDATRKDLFDFLVEVKGLDLGAFSSRHTLELLRGKLNQLGETIDFITIEEADQPITMEDESDDKWEERVRIIIDRSDAVGGDQPVPVGCNGPVTLLPRGTEIVVKRKLVEILKNAVRSIVVPGKDGMDNTLRDVPQYPFRIIQDPA